VGVQRRARRPGGRRAPVCPSCAGVGHETDVTLAGLRGGRAGAHAVCGHAELVVPDRLEAAGIVGHSRTAPRWPRAVALPRRPGRGGGASSPSRDSSHAPSSRRPVNAWGCCSTAPQGPRRPAAGRGGRPGADRGTGPTGRERAARAAAAGLGTATASLMALGPQATLDRGYAIVRRIGDGPSCATRGTRRPGLRLDHPLSRGAIAATSDGPGASDARVPR